MSSAHAFLPVLGEGRSRMFDVKGHIELRFGNIGGHFKLGIRLCRTFRTARARFLSLSTVCFGWMRDTHMSKHKGCPPPTYDNRMPMVFPAPAPKYASILPRGTSSSPPCSRSRTHLRFCALPSDTLGAGPVEKIDKESINTRNGNSNTVASSADEADGGVGDADGDFIGGL
jgi:hypothetical protein